MVSPHLGVSKNTGHPTISLGGIWPISMTIPFQSWVLQKIPWFITVYYLHFSIFFPSFFGACLGYPGTPKKIRPTRFLFFQGQAPRTSSGSHRSGRWELLRHLQYASVVQGWPALWSIGLENPPFLDICFGCFKKRNHRFSCNFSRDYCREIRHCSPISQQPWEFDHSLKHQQPKILLSIANNINKLGPEKGVPQNPTWLIIERA